MNSNPNSTTNEATDDFGVATSPGTLRIERVLPGPIERVWKYLTDSEMRGRWFCSGHMEFRPGGKFEMIFRNADLTEGHDPPPAKYADHDKETLMQGRIKACDPPNLLTFSWLEPSGQASEVTFKLTEQDNQVRLVLTHRDLGNLDEMIGVAAGWHTHVGILVDILNDRKSPKFWVTLMELEEKYAERITEDDVIR